MENRLSMQFFQTLFAFMCFYLLAASREAKAQQNPYIDSLLQALEAQDPDISDISTLHQIAMYYTDADPVKGLEYAKQARGIAARKDNRMDLAKANNAVASNWLMLLEVDSALYYFDEALALYEEEGDKKGMGDIAGNKGHAAYHMGRYDDALQYYFEALTYYEEVEFEHGIINQHASLGIAYMAQGKYPEAISHDTIALNGFAKLKDSLGYAMVLGNLANIYTELRDFDQAISHFKQAADIYERTHQPLGMGRNLVNLAALYVDLGQYVPALETARKGLKICSDNNIGLCVQYSLSNISTAYLESYLQRSDIGGSNMLIPGDPQELLQLAIDYMEQAVTLTDRLESPLNFEEAHRKLSIAYKHNGQFEKALKHHEIYAAINDSLSSVERASRIEQLTTDREIAVRDKQIELDKLRLKVKRNERIYFIIGLALLAGWLLLVYRNALNQRKSNQQLNLLNGQISSANLQLEDRNVRLTQTLEELKSTQQQLIEAERQKENEILRRRISRDIHDDISSSLSKISWMTEVMSKNHSPNEQADPEMLHRIASYSRETVSKLGEIIWSTKPESDNFSGLVSYCREFLSKYLEGLPLRWHIDFPEEGDDTPLNPELRRNIYLVMKEAVHNAVKYSKATQLTVALHVDDGVYRLIVEDNGIGMNLRESSSVGNGFRNMHGRMQEVSGRMEVHSSPGKGTRLEFSGQVY